LSAGVNGILKGSKIGHRIAINSARLPGWCAAEANAVIFPSVAGS